MNNSKTYVTLETNRSGYSPDQCGNTMTVQELIDCLSSFDPNAKIYFSNDDGYTYGEISAQDIERHYEDEDEEC